MSRPDYVHLQAYSEYSLTRSLIRPKELVKAAKERGMYAVGISDLTNMFATIRFYNAAMAEGIKPIISSEVIVTGLVGGTERTGQLTLVCQNQEGYKNLTELISQGYEEGRESDDELPVLKSEWFEGKTNGIIVLSGGRNGIAGKEILSGNPELAAEYISDLAKQFPNRLYIELQRAGHPHDDRYVHAATKIAAEQALPVVATNGVCFLNPEDKVTHDIRRSISEKVTLTQYTSENEYSFTSDQYLKTPQEMAALFSDIPSAITNSVKIAERCSLDISMYKNYLPAFPVPEGMTESDYLRDEAKIGLDKRLDFIYGLDNPNISEIRKEYDERLDFELNVINEMGFPGYFLIVSDFIVWAKEQNIPVGPGRGSGAGSLAAYSLGITDLDPLKYDLLFERFLNPERVSMPDFDIDFCMDRREEVINYVTEKYGHKSVSQIITFGTMAAKMVVRDVSRALGFPYGVGNRISQLIPAIPGIKLKQAMEESMDFQLLYQNDPDVKLVIDHSLKLEGITRQTGRHAGGVLIAPKNLTDHTPTHSSADGTSFVSQFDKNDVETAGLVKFDFLGLRTLTIVQSAIDSINKERVLKKEEPINILGIDLDDSKVFDLLTDAQTTAVFQVESKGMKDMLKRMRPDCLEDLIALVALYRPGPLESGMVDNFINRKHGREELAYPDPNYQHELLKPILEPTYGIILYQEQVMQIAQVLAGYTLGGADMLRRAMGKKDAAEMAQQRSLFEQGARDNGIDPHLAIKIFDLVEKFAGYGFNKSHSAAYALISYQTAWLKVHYPAEFMAAVLSSDMQHKDKVVNYINECKNMGLNILPPSINNSERSFVAFNGEVIYGLEAVKGLGVSATNTILEERKKNGPYTSLHDLCKRANPRKTTIEAAIKSGALDDLGPSRAALMLAYPSAQASGKQARLKEDLPQDDLFGNLEDEYAVVFPDVAELTEKERLEGERLTLGHYLSSHPIDEYEDQVAHFTDGKIASLIENNLEDGNSILEGEQEEKVFKARPVVVAGHIMDMEVKVGKRGHTAYLVLDDNSMQIDVAVYNKTYNDCLHTIKPNETVIIEGWLRQDRKTGRYTIVANGVKGIDTVREQKVSHIMLNLNPGNMSPERVASLKEIILKHPEGGCRIRGRYTNSDITKEIPIGEKDLKITDELVHELKSLFGNDSVDIIYKGEKGIEGKSVSRYSKEERLELKEEGERTKEQRHKAISNMLEEARNSMAM